MSTHNTEEAALAWADKMERGETGYDAYLVALAHLVRAQRQQIDKLVTLLGITPENAPNMEQAGEALAAAQTRIHDLAATLRTLTRWDIYQDDYLHLDGQQYRVIKDADAKQLAREITSARMLLGDDEA